MRRSARLLLLAFLAVPPCGCQRVLFPKHAPRTQFETYDTMRNRHVPLTEPDVFGNPQPALRARLSQPR